MKIDINKKYRTRGGLAVEIFKVMDDSYNSKWKVFGAIIDDRGILVAVNWTDTGRYATIHEHSSDLVEVFPYDDFKVDDKVVCWDDAFPDSQRMRYFSHVGKDGRPNTFVDGATSWSNRAGQYVAWDNCVKYAE